MSFFGGGSSSSSGGGILPTFQEEPACADMCPNLTYQQRIIGYIGCTAVGVLLSLLGSLILFGGTNSSNIQLFAVLFVLGNIVALCATGFLLGPAAQCKKMWDPTRRWSTAFYLTMIIVVLVVALMKQNVFLVLFLLLVEVTAGAWYSLSFVPFGRKIVLNFLRATGVCFPCFWVHDNVKETCCKKDNKNSSTTSILGGSKDKSSSSSSSSSSSFFGLGSSKPEPQPEPPSKGWLW